MHLFKMQDILVNSPALYINKHTHTQNNVQPLPRFWFVYDYHSCSHTTQYENTLGLCAFQLVEI